MKEACQKIEEKYAKVKAKYDVLKEKHY